MTAYQYRMPAGTPGDVTRIHPSSIRGFVNDASGSNPLSYTGQAALFHGSTSTIRAVDHTDDSAKGGTTVAIAGITCRPYPTQDSGAGETFGQAGYGAGVVNPGAITDILTQGSILVLQNQPTGTFAATSTLGGTVYVRVTAGTGAFAALPVGGFEVVQDATSSAYQLTVANAYWNGGADSFGVGELTLID